MDEAAVIAKILNSRTFRSSDSLGPLLEFLYANRHRLIRSKDIDKEHYKLGKKSIEDPAHARERVKALRGYLRRYYAEEPGDTLVCSIADGNEGLGYYVKFKKVKPGQIATSNFWEPHFSADSEPSVVCDSLLFFYKHDEGRLVRYVDTNIEGTNRANAIAELTARHPRHADERLVAGHLYVDAGSVLAADILREHFWSNWERRVPLVVEKEATKVPWKSGSPILIATPRTNNFMRGVFRDSASKVLGYRIPSDRYACVTIATPRPSERKELKKLGKGIRWITKETFTTESPELTLGIVTRIPNPHGDGGVLTFVSSDATWSVKQLAITLTKEGRLRRLLDAMEWSYAQSLPSTFELLFLVELWPADIDDEAASPKLLGWRYPKEKTDRVDGVDSASLIDDFD